MAPTISWIQVLLLVVATSYAELDWTPEFLAQTQGLKCMPGKKQHDVTFLHGTESGDFKKLGKVADMDVCMLLCCERDECEAAFMANNNCYAVKCRTPEHCVTAPARNNKWHPVVAFLKRTNSDVTEKKSTSSKTLSPSRVLDSTEQATATKKTEANSTSKKQSIEQPTGEKHADGHVTAESVVRLEEVDKKPEAPRLTDNPREAKRQRELRKAKFSIISAAVATCLMACVLSGMALIAAKIRRRKEQMEEHEDEYTTLPTHD